MNKIINKIMKEDFLYIKEFEKVLDDFYGLFLDSGLGFSNNLNWFEYNQNINKNINKISIEELDKTNFIYGDGEPEDVNSYLHRITQGELKIRNKKGGSNEIKIGNMIISAIYNSWESHYRQKISAEINKKKEDLEIDIFGDLKNLRNSIVHNKGVANSKVNGNTIITWFKKEDEIFINDVKMKFIVKKIKEELSKINNYN